MGCSSSRNGVLRTLYPFEMGYTHISESRSSLSCWNVGGFLGSVGGHRCRELAWLQAILILLDGCQFCHRNTHLGKESTNPLIKDDESSQQIEEEIE